MTHLTEKEELDMRPMREERRQMRSQVKAQKEMMEPFMEREQAEDIGKME